MHTPSSVHGQYLCKLKSYVKNFVVATSPRHEATKLQIPLIVAALVRGERVVPLKVASPKRFHDLRRNQCLAVGQSRVDLLLPIEAVGGPIPSKRHTAIARRGGGGGGGRLAICHSSSSICVLWTTRRTVRRSGRRKRTKIRGFQHEAEDVFPREFFELASESRPPMPTFLALRESRVARGRRAAGRSHL